MRNQPTPPSISPLNLSRRRFMSMAGFAGAGLFGSGLLAACGTSSPGGGGTTTSAPASGSASTGGTSGAPGSPGTAGSSESSAPLGQLDIYTWEGYDLQSEMKEWRERNGVTLNASYVGVQDDVATKLTSPSAAGIDLSTANQSFITYFNSLGIMSPITVDEVPELAGLFKPFQGKPWVNDDGTFNSVPWTWGPLGLSYVPERLDSPATWDVLFEPSLKGRITMLDDPQQHTQLAAAILGHNPDQLTKDQLAEVKDYLIRIVKQCKTITATTGDQVSLMESGEIDLVFLGWTGIDSAAKAKGFEAITMIPPNARSTGFSDASFIPPGADNRPAALAFTRQLVSGPIAAAAAETFFAATTAPEVVPLINAETRKPYPYDNIESYFEQLTFPQGFPREPGDYITLDEAVKMWEEVKAEAP